MVVEGWLRIILMVIWHQSRYLVDLFFFVLSRSVILELAGGSLLQSMEYFFVNREFTSLPKLLLTIFHIAQKWLSTCMCILVFFNVLLQ